MNSKQLENAKDLLEAAQDSLESKDSLFLEKVDIETIKWLIKQAQQAALYRKALGELSNGKIRTQEQSHLIASSALIEAEFFFNDKIFPQEGTVKK